MDGSFACPDCGCSIALAGRSPGREVVCDFCGARVVIPFLPRVGPGRGPRPRPRGTSKGVAGWWRWANTLPIWGRLAVGVLMVVLSGAMLERLIRARVDVAERRSLDDLVAEARLSEGEGRVGDALSELEGALAYAAQMRTPPATISGLRGWRDDLSAQDARARLKAIGPEAKGLDPARAAGEAMTLLARAEKDDALTGLVPEIQRALVRQLERWSEADGVEARRLIDAGDAATALDRCLRMYQTAQELAPASRKRLEAEAAALAGEVISLRGTIIEPAQGRFTLGSAELYDRVLQSSLTGALRRQGYLPRPSTSPWDDLWASRSPYRLICDVAESQNETYLESPNRISRIEVRLALRRGDELLWNERVQARTEVPLPRAPAYVASRLAVSSTRSREFERLLYDSARASLDVRLAGALRDLPAWPVNRSTADDP